MEYSLDRSTVVNRWNNAYLPRLTIQSGDTVHIQMRDSSDGQVHPGMTSAAFSEIDTTRIHALTGPIEIKGAAPGDRLRIEILGYQHEGWAWTSIIPGLGLLKDDFKAHFLHHWELGATETRSMPGLAIPLAPFCGIIGVQPATVGEFRTRPPGTNGGNMDVRHLTAGSILHLPVLTPGAGLCVGDAHAAQGDGEVSINGMEAPMSVSLKIDLIRGQPLLSPALEVLAPLDPPAIANNSHIVFIESDEDPRVAAQRVVRRAIDYLMRRVGLSREQAYVTCSVVIRLKISQLVNIPTMTISGYIPEGIFLEPAPKDFLP